MWRANSKGKNMHVFKAKFINGSNESKSMDAGEFNSLKIQIVFHGSFLGLISQIIKWMYENIAT